MHSTLLVAATGTGKTVMLAEVCRRWARGRILWLAHTDELCRQPMDTLTACGLTVDLEKAEYEADQCVPAHRSKVVVGSVQTLAARRCRRAKKFEPNEFGLIITDEAHRSRATSYRAIYEHFAANPNVCHLGATATPDRGDGRPLEFHSLAYEYQYPQAVADGYLVPIRAKIVTIDSIDLTKVRAAMGDLATGELDRLVGEEANILGIAQSAMELCGDKRTLVFTPGVYSAHRLASQLNQYRAGCAVAIDGSTKNRRTVLDQHGVDGCQFLINCAVLTEGYDDPAIQCVINARPTKVRSLLIQMVGRGTRLIDSAIGQLPTREQRLAAIAASAKPHVDVYDFCGVVGRHKLCTTVELLVGGDDDDREAARAAARNSSEPLTKDELEAAQEAAAQRRAERSEAGRDVRLGDALEYSVQDVDEWGVPTASAKRVLGSEPCSEAQLAYLTQLGVAAGRAKKLSRGAASRLIDDLVTRQQRGLATYAQCRELKKFGIEARTLTKDQAAGRMEEVTRAIRTYGYARAIAILKRKNCRDT